MMLERIWEWIEYNRFLVILPVVALVLWLTAYGCSPLVESPLSPGKFVNERELLLDVREWENRNNLMLAKFEAAQVEIAEIKAAQGRLAEIALNLATGQVADLPSLLQLLLAGGGIGAVVDNIRKRGVISGLKRNA